MQCSPVEKYMPLAARILGLKEDILFLEIVITFFGGGGSSEAAMGWGVRSAMMGVAMSQKDGCAHVRPKPTSNRIKAFNPQSAIVIKIQFASGLIQ